MNYVPCNLVIFAYYWNQLSFAGHNNNWSDAMQFSTLSNSYQHYHFYQSVYLNPTTHLITCIVAMCLKQAYLIDIGAVSLMFLFFTHSLICNYQLALNFIYKIHLNYIIYSTIQAIKLQLKGCWLHTERLMQVMREGRRMVSERRRREAVELRFALNGWQHVVVEQGVASPKWCFISKEYITTFFYLSNTTMQNNINKYYIELINADTV